jgi:hypothetical protein
MASITMNVGQTATMTLSGLDQYGQPFTLSPDSAPTWTNTTPADATLTAAPSGLTATDLAIAAGSDAVTATMIEGGKSFAVTQSFTINQAAPVLASIVINTTVA